MTTVPAWYAKETAGESRRRRYTFKVCKGCGDFFTPHGRLCKHCQSKNEH